MPRVSGKTKRVKPAEPDKEIGVGQTASPQPAPAAEESTLIRDLNDPHRKRGTYALIQRAIDVAMDVPFDAMRAACMTAVRDLGSNDDRIRSRAREFLLKVQDSGLGAAVNMDRMNRLDDGTATENIAVASITPETLQAVVQTLRGDR